MGDLGKLIVATGFENLPKVQLITQSGHTGWVCKWKLSQWRITNQITENEWPNRYYVQQYLAKGDGRNRLEEISLGSLTYSVTRSGDLLDFGQLLNAFGNF